MSKLSSYLGVELHAGASLLSERFLLKGIDACLGVDGVPQSATGQTTLFTGQNAAEILGHHYPAFPTASLQKILKKHSFLKQLTDLGVSCTFVNPFTEAYFELVKAGKRKHSASTLSTLAAELPFRFESDLLQV